MSVKGRIFNIMRYSIHDGPGIRTTVFFKGCPLRCQWCHNPEALESKPSILYRRDRCLRCGTCMMVCPLGVIEESEGYFVTDRESCLQCGTCVNVCYAEARELVGREVTVADVLAEVELDRVFYEESGGGVTFSGGEPLLQPDFLLALLRVCRQKGIHTAVDTTGHTTEHMLKEFAEAVDLFLFDLKIMDDQKHRSYTGFPNGVILENLRRLARWRKTVIVRLPIIPGVNDDRENIMAVGQFVSSLETVKEIQLLPYHTAGVDKYEKLGLDYRLPDIRPPGNEVMMQIAGTLESFGLSVTIGG
jgi:pyruvate formate lyase activating enzyme